MLGGSAPYFALAAKLYTDVGIVAVIGDDFPEDHIGLLERKGIDLTGLQRSPGETFFWSGRYHYDMNTRDTLETRLGVFADFRPTYPPATARRRTCSWRTSCPPFRWPSRSRLRVRGWWCWTR